MSDSVLDRIRQNRKRPAVPVRDDTLISNAQQPDPVQETETVEIQPRQLKQETTERSPKDTLETLKEELAKIPATNRHSAIVLEKELDQTLTHYCRDNRITLEVFLEASWVYASNNPKAMAKILKEAKRRYRDRKQAGKLRRLITMLGG